MLEMLKREAAQFVLESRLPLRDAPLRTHVRAQHIGRDSRRVAVYPHLSRAPC